MRFLSGFVLALVLVAVGLFAYFAMGYAPVATDSAPMFLEARLAHMALHARIAHAGDKKAPIEANETNLVAGAHLYREQCAVCHGLPNQPETAIAHGMFPDPPQLFKHSVTDDPASETYWKVANGIRLTGMPGYKGSLKEDQLWQVSLMLAGADKLPAAATAVLQAPMNQTNW